MKKEIENLATPSGGEVDVEGIAREQAFEEACAAICDYCRNDGKPDDMIGHSTATPAGDDGGPRFLHRDEDGVDECAAEEIREVMAKSLSRRIPAPATKDWLGTAAESIAQMVDIWFQKMNLPTSNKQGRDLFKQAISDLIERAASTTQNGAGLLPLLRELRNAAIHHKVTSSLIDRVDAVIFPAPPVTDGSAKEKDNA